jgi:chitodextrinase
VNGGSWTSIGNVLSVELTGLTISNTYTVAVRARDSAGNIGAPVSGSFTTVDNIPPSAPGVPTITNVGGNSATASWTAATDNIGVTGYEYSITGGASWIGVGTALSVNLTGLTSGVSYTFYVRAFDAAGNRGPQPSASFNTVDNVPPSAPGTPTVSSLGSTTATLSWTAASDNVGVAAYVYTINGGVNWYNIGATLSVNLTGLGSGVSYTFYVAAVDAAGNWSSASAVAFRTNDTVPPSAPGTPSISSITATSATASWTAATDNVGVSGYEYTTNGGFSWTGVGTALSVSLTGLSATTAYTVYVRAYDAAGNRSTSTSAGFTTSAPIMTVGTYSSGGASAYGYIVGDIGSMAPTTLSSTLSFVTVSDTYNPGYPPYVPASQSSTLTISGFTADPGWNWLVSVTAHGTTLTTTYMSAYGYSNGTASWQFTPIFGLIAIPGGTTPVAVAHH